MPRYTEMTFSHFFWRSTVHSAKFRQMRAAVTIMAANYRVSQFSKRGASIVFGK